MVQTTRGWMPRAEVEAMDRENPGMQYILTGGSDSMGMPDMD